MNDTGIRVREGACGAGDDPRTVSSWRRGVPIRFPRTRGADIVGRVDAAGKQVDDGLAGGTQGGREDSARVRDFVLSGRVGPVLAATYPLEDIARAVADFVAGDFVGKLVVTTGRSR